MSEEDRKLEFQSTEIDFSGYAPNVVAGATALIVYFAPQIAALIPAEAQTIILLVVMAAMGVTGGGIGVLYEAASSTMIRLVSFFPESLMYNDSRRNSFNPRSP